MPPDPGAPRAKLGGKHIPPALRRGPVKLWGNKPTHRHQGVGQSSHHPMAPSRLSMNQTVRSSVVNSKQLITSSLAPERTCALMNNQTGDSIWLPTRPGIVGKGMDDQFITNSFRREKNI